MRRRALRSFAFFLARKRMLLRRFRCGSVVLFFMAARRLGEGSPEVETAAPSATLPPDGDPPRSDGGLRPDARAASDPPRRARVRREGAAAPRRGVRARRPLP